MGLKTLITYNFGEEKMEGLRKLGCDLIYIPEKEVAYSEELSDVEVLIGYKFRRKALSFRFGMDSFLK